MVELAYNLESFNPAFTAVLLKVSIGTACSTQYPLCLCVTAFFMTSPALTSPKFMHKCDTQLPAIQPAMAISTDLHQVAQPQASALSLVCDLVVDTHTQALFLQFPGPKLHGCRSRAASGTAIT